MATITRDDVNELHNSPEFQQLVANVITGDGEAAQESDALNQLGQSLLEAQATALARKEVDAEVAYRKPRVAWRKEADQLREREAAYREAQAAVDEHLAQWRAAEEEHLRMIQALSETAQTASQAMSWSYAAVRKLREGYRGPLRAELAETHAETQRLAEALGDARQRRNHLRWDLTGPVQQLVGMRRETRAKLEARRDSIDQEISRLQSAIEENRRQAEAINRQMLEP
jgi:chromosome segregation ATPase